jgi:hypothetical protein
VEGLEIIPHTSTCCLLREFHGGDLERATKLHTDRPSNPVIVQGTSASQSN